MIKYNTIAFVFSLTLLLSNINAINAIPLDELFKNDQQIAKQDVESDEEKQKLLDSLSPEDQQALLMHMQAQIQKKLRELPEPIKNWLEENQAKLKEKVDSKIEVLKNVILNNEKKWNDCNGKEDQVMHRQKLQSELNSAICSHAKILSTSQLEKEYLIAEALSRHPDNINQLVQNDAENPFTAVKRILNVSEGTIDNNNNNNLN